MCAARLDQDTIHFPEYSLLIAGQACAFHRAVLSDPPEE
jgi:hypothetical protein